MPFDPVTAFTPVTLVAEMHMLMVLNPNVPVRTVPDFIALAKKDPGRVTFGSPGNGTTGHLGMEMLQSAAGIRLTRRAPLSRYSTGKFIRALREQDMQQRFTGLGARLAPTTPEEFAAKSDTLLGVRSSSSVSPRLPQTAALLITIPAGRREPGTAAVCAGAIRQMPAIPSGGSRPAGSSPSAP